MNSAIVLGQDMLEEILSKRYDERTIPPYSSWSSRLGRDAGESSRSSYDDVDDSDYLQGAHKETSIAGFPGFSREVSVCYVDPDGGSLDKCLADSAQTDYKKIEVIVNHALIGNVRFSMIVSSEYPK